MIKMNRSVHGSAKLISNADDRLDIGRIFTAETQLASERRYLIGYIRAFGVIAVFPHRTIYFLFCQDLSSVMREGAEDFIFLAC